MNDIIIKEKHIRREAFWAAGCFAAAFAMNLGAVIAYDRPWTELLSQIGYVVFLTVVIYLILLIVRLLVGLMMRLFKRSQ